MARQEGIFLFARLALAEEKDEILARRVIKAPREVTWPSFVALRTIHADFHQCLVEMEIEFLVEYIEPVAAESFDVHHRGRYGSECSGTPTKNHDGHAAR